MPITIPRLQYRRTGFRPQWPFVYNKRSPFALGLEGFWPFQPANAGDNVYDAAKRHHGTINNTTNMTWIIRELMGYGVRQADSDTVFTNCGLVNMANWVAVTVIVWFAWDEAASAKADEHSLISNLEGGGPTPANVLFHLEPAGNHLEGFVRDSVPAQVGGSFTDLTVDDTEVHVAQLTYDAAGVLRCWLDGVESTITFSGTAGLSGTNSTEPLALGGATFRVPPTDYFTGDIFHAQVNEADLSGIGYWIYAPQTRFDLYYMPGRVFYSIPAAVSITPPAGALALTGIAPDRMDLGMEVPTMVRET